MRVGCFFNYLLVKAAPGQLRPDSYVRLAPGCPVFVQPFFLKLGIQWSRHDTKGLVGLSYSASWPIKPVALEGLTSLAIMVMVKSPPLLFCVIQLAPDSGRKSRFGDKAPIVKPVHG